MHRTGTPPPPARLAASVLAVLLALAVLVPPSPPAPLSAEAGAAQPDIPIRARAFDIEARYDPPTQTLSVTCAMKFDVLRDGPALTVGLRTWFDPPEIAQGAGLVGWVSAGVSGDWRQYRTAGPLRAGQTLNAVWTYKGSPSDYDAAQDRYWSRARQEAVWVTDTNAWMPSPYVRWRASDADFRLAVTVPADWTVFAPGLPATWDPPAEDGRRTFVYQSRAGDPAVPCWWLAGRYTKVASGQAAGVPYSVWSLPGWEKQARPLATETPRMISFLGRALGELPPIEMRVVQVHPDQGGGVSSGEGLTAVSPLGTKSKFGLASTEALWCHEFAHSLAYFGDEGWAETLALYYVAEEYPQRFAAELGAARDYFLDAVAKHGDFDIREATKRHFGPGDLPEWHAYVYVKPALVWNSYRGLFGKQAFTDLLQALQRDFRTRGWSVPVGDWSDPALWDAYFAVYRADAIAAAEAAGGPAAGVRAGAFFDRWFDGTYRLDLAVENVAARPAGTGATAAGSGSGSPAAEGGSASPAVEGGSASPGTAAAAPEQWVVSFDIRDVRQAAAPPARQTVPSVEVAVSTAGGDNRSGPGSGPRIITARVDLTGDITRVELTVPGRPLQLTLDPNIWLLDYDYSNNVAEIPVPTNPSDVIRVAAVAATLLAAAGTGFWWARRRPRRLKPPPMAGHRESPAA